VIAAALAFLAVASLRALLDGIALKVVSVPPSADAVTGPTLPAAGSSGDASVSLAGPGTPRLGSGHQERTEGKR
jgi:hypothetical protein